MKASDIKLELELGGVDKADIAEIMTLCTSKGLTVEMIDEELQKRGYDKIFTVDYESYDDYDDWDDEFVSVEKIRHKQHYKD